MEERKQIFAEPGESIDSFEEKFYEYKEAHKSALFIFNGIVVDTESPLTFIQQFQEGNLQREIKYQLREDEEKKKVNLSIEQMMDQFTQYAKDNENLTTDEIMSFLGAIGDEAYKITGDVSNLNPEKCRAVIDIIVQNGYMPASEDTTYRIVTIRDEIFPFETCIRVGDVAIACKRSAIPFFDNSDSLSEYAIGNALTQLSKGSILCANYDFSWEYESIKKREAQKEGRQR